MSTTSAPMPPQTWLKTAVTALKKTQKDPTYTENEIQTKEQAISFLLDKNYILPGNHVNLQTLAHVLSQLGAAARKMLKTLTDGISAIVVLMND